MVPIAQCLGATKLFNVHHILISALPCPPLSLSLLKNLSSDKRCWTKRSNPRRDRAHKP